MSLFTNPTIRRPLLVVATLLAASATQAQANPWTTAASAGVVDEADTGLVDFVAGEARMRNTAAAGSVLNLRYNVVSLPGFTGPGQYVLRSRFRDNGAGANVRLELRSYQTSGLNSLLGSLDSNNFTASPSYQIQGECVVVDWDFNTSVYYIEATLQKTSSAGQPALGMIQLVPGNCIS